MPRRMLRHKAAIQCARYAFALSGLYDEDEARDIVARDQSPAVVLPPRAGSKTEALKAEVAARRKDAGVTEGDADAKA